MTTKQVSQVNDYQNRIHDFFNLIVLPIISSVYVWHMLTLYSMPPDDDQITILSLPRESGNSLAWRVLYGFFMTYMLVDSVWVMLYPQAVASPKIIIVHHLVCITGFLLARGWTGWEFYASAGLCVEFNTFFLIAKRRFPSTRALYWLDNLTWIVTRLIMFPIVTWNSLCVWLWMSATFPAGRFGKYWNTGLLMTFFASSLMVLNLAWSKDKFILLMQGKSSKGL